MRPDAYLIDEKLVTMHGEVFRPLRPVARIGDRFRLPDRTFLDGQDSLSFLLVEEAQAVSVRVGYRLFVPADQTDLSAVPWHDVPSRAKRGDPRVGPAGYAAVDWTLLMPKRIPNPRRASAAKRQTLERAFALGRPVRNNAEVLYTVVERAVEAGFMDLAISAISAMRIGNDDEWQLCRAVDLFLESRQRWPAVSPGTADRWQSQVLGTKRSSDDWPRSLAIGRLGLLRLARGDQEGAIQLWSTARGRGDVDDAISEVAIEVAEQGGRASVTVACALVELIHGRGVKAKALAQLTAYL